MTQHFADRLAEAVRKKNTGLCVGLYPRYASLPNDLKAEFDHSYAGVATAYQTFCLRVLELVEPFSAVVKPQSSFFEQCGPDGMKVQQSVLCRAREMGFITILDAKRGDIASTATAYAQAAAQVWNADAITVNRPPGIRASPAAGSPAASLSAEANNAKKGSIVTSTIRFTMTA